MSGQTFSALAPLITVSGAFFLAGLGFFFKATSKLTEVITILKMIQIELGNHETGLRGSVHKMKTDLLVLSGRVSVLEERNRNEN